MSDDLIRLSELGRLLKDTRTVRQISLSKIVKWLQQEGPRLPWLSWKRHQIEHFEDGEVTGTCSLQEARSLASIYGVSDLMVDSLVSESVPGHFVQEDFREFVLIRPFGHGSRYLIPQHALQGKDPVFLILCLAPGDLSELHKHPGDEFILVRKGTVDLCLYDTNQCETLTQDDYVHFYSEKPHRLVNNSKKMAEVLVLRFYQFHRGIRQRVSNAVMRFLAQMERRADLPESVFRSFRRDVAPWLRQVATESSVDPIRVGPDDYYQPSARNNRVQNFVDLSRVIRGLNDSRRRPYNQTRLVEEFNDRVRRWNEDHRDDSVPERKRHQIWNFLHGFPVPDATSHDLMVFADIFGIPAILLAGYLYPAGRDIVVIRGNENRYGHKVDDVEEFPDDVFHCSPSVKYSLPRHTLAQSDVAIAFVEFPPKSATVWNRHPGTELILPLRGSVTVNFKNLLNSCAASDGDEYCHFLSEHEHQVVNESSRRAAEILVVRFYRFNEENDQENGHRSE
jgi:quercetin dioxygenase-like cupin family protein